MPTPSTEVVDPTERPDLEMLGAAYTQYATMLSQSGLFSFLWNLLTVVFLFVLVILALVATPFGDTKHAIIFVSYGHAIIISFVAVLFYRYTQHMIRFYDSLYEGRFLALIEFESRWFKAGLFAPEWHRVGAEYFNMRYRRPSSLIASKSLLLAVIVSTFSKAVLATYLHW